MPVAGQIFTKKVALPNYPPEDPAWVVMITNPKADLFTNSKNEETGSLGQNVLLSKLITEWNFTDKETKEVLPITAENVEKCLGGIEQAHVMASLNVPPSFLALIARRA